MVKAYHPKSAVDCFEILELPEYLFSKEMDLSKSFK